MRDHADFIARVMITVVGFTLHLAALLFGILGALFSQGCGSLACGDDGGSSLLRLSGALLFWAFLHATAFLITRGLTYLVDRAYLNAAANAFESD